MTRTGQIDIATLRRRINSSVSRSLGGSGRSAMGVSAPQRPAQPRERKQLGLDGEERENSLGRFLSQEHLYANGRMHGNVPIQWLQGLGADWLESISGGEVTATDPKRWAFLDTETTGLAGGTGTCAFLVGVGAIEDDGFRVRLFFMRDYDEEPAMLRALAKRLGNYDVLISYNGKSFDVPLLETRYRLKRQRNPLDGMGHVDLLHAARRVWRERMPNCRLGTLESEILGVERQGDVPGSLIPQRYFDFLRSGRGTPLKPVFHHNVLDIVSLACLGSVLMPVYAAPEKAPLRHGEDLLGIARWLARLGDSERALHLYRRAIHAGLPASQLFPSLWEAARLERRTGNAAAQVRLLRDLSRVANKYRAAAFEELAKHYEHRERDFGRALEMTRRAQRHAPSEGLKHREDRLLRRIGIQHAVGTTSS